MKYKGNKNKNGYHQNRNIAKKLAILGIVLTLGGGTSIKEYHEHTEKNEIEQNAQLEVMRCFNHIDTEKSGKYLANQVKQLYEKYPQLDSMIFHDDNRLKTEEFANDIYLLYKAKMVDAANKDPENIDDVKVNTADRLLVLTSDIVYDKETKIAQTHREQDKEITNLFVKAKESPKEGSIPLAKEMYEFLVKEVGLKEKAKTSPEMVEEIQNKGFYYDEINQIFYTDRGTAHLEEDKTEKLQSTVKTQDQKITNHIVKTSNKIIAEEDEEIGLD